MFTRRVLRIPCQFLNPRVSFFWGPNRYPFDGLEREFHRIEDEFRRLNREIKHSIHEINPFNQDNRVAILSPLNKSLEKEQTFIDKEGNKKVQLAFDFANFKPGDIKVKADGHKISISAKNTEKSEKGSIYREFYREYTLPENVDVENIKSILAPDGTLTLEAPIKQIEASNSTEVEIPIERKMLDKEKEEYK